jgi:hypothetical protein
MLVGVPVRHRAAERGSRRGRDLLDTLLREAEEARVAAGLSYGALGRALRLSPAQVGRLLRRQADDVGLVRVAELLGAVGLDLSARAFPAGPPVRDAPSIALLDRFRQRLHALCVVRAEVPVVELLTPGIVDMRAWDLAVDGPGWTLRLDAETRLGDVQALLRRTALKQRDSAVDCVVLLLAETRHNRATAEAARAPLVAQFPVPPRLALARLGRGATPGGNALIFL